MTVPIVPEAGGRTSADEPDKGVGANNPQKSGFVKGFALTPQEHARTRSGSLAVCAAIPRGQVFVKCTCLRVLRFRQHTGGDDDHQRKCYLCAHN